MTTSTENPCWIHYQRQTGCISSRWFLFHHAGGSASTFARWFRYIPKNADIYCLELPGRGKNSQHTFITEWKTLMQTIMQSVSHLLDQPFIFFGHSLGAGVAFELSQSLDTHHLPTPQHLFLSGRIAPSRRAENTQVDLSRNGLLEYMRTLDGTPKEIFEDKSLLDLLLPRIRADLMLNTGYVPTLNNSLNIPITVYAGTEDDGEKEDYLAWQQLTNAPFQLKYFPGNHFFINDHFRAIIQDIHIKCKLAMSSKK